MKIERYQAYKNSEVAWLGDVPEHWETHTVKRVAKVGYKNFVDGDWIESPFITDKGIRLIQTGNVGIGIYKEKGWRYIAEKTFSDLNCTEIYPGDVLICRLDGPVGRACLVPDLQVRMITSVDNTILKPSKDFDPKFIVYVMSSSLWLEWIQALCRVGGGFRFRISRSMLGELRIQKPPLSEQKAIAHYLDTKTAQIDRKIELLIQKASLYSNLKQSLINETVTRGLDESVPMKDSGIEWLGEVPEHWEFKRLKDIANIQNSNVDKKTYEYEVPVKLCNYVDVYKNDFISASLSFMEATASESEIKQFTIRKGDVFITKDSETCDDIAIPALATESLEGVLCGYHLAQLRTKEKIFLGAYLFRLFQAKSYGFRFVISAKGITRVGLGQSAIADSLTPVPPVLEQKAIADYLDTKTAQIDQIIQTINTQIEKLKELRKTLINDVVTGKIKVV